MEAAEPTRASSPIDDGYFRDAHLHHHLAKQLQLQLRARLVKFILAHTAHLDVYFLKRKDPISVRKVLANKADTLMGVSPSASNFVYVGGSHGTASSLTVIQLRHHA